MARLAKFPPCTKDREFPIDVGHAVIGRVRLAGELTEKFTGRSEQAVVRGFTAAVDSGQCRRPGGRPPASQTATGLHASRRVCLRVSVRPSAC